MKNFRFMVIILALFLVISTPFVLFAGGGKKEAPKAEKLEVGEFGNYEGVTIRVALLGGDHPVPWKEKMPEFEKLTGAEVQIIDLPWEELYSKTFLELSAQTGAYDIVELAGFWVPDYVLNDYLAPLGEYYKQWDWAMNDIVDAYQKIGSFRGDRYSVIADGDVLALYYRKDLIDDLKYKQEFKQKYGYDLRAPETWDEFFDIAKFFNERDTDGDGKVDLWGCEAMLSRAHGPITFMQLLRSFDCRFFDPYTMEPAITSKAGRKAVETMVKMAQYMSLGAPSHDFTITRDNFTNGNAFMVLQWADVGAWSGTAPESAVKGKVGYGLVPAGKIDGKTYRRSELAWNWQWAVSANSPNIEAAAQLLRFMTAPDTSLDIISMARGYDPYRHSHYNNKEWAEGWFPNSDKFLDGLKENLKYGSYDLYIPGMQQYLDSVGKHLGDVLTDSISVDEGLQRIADEWNAITDEWGRESQQEFYQDYLKNYWGWEG